MSESDAQQQSRRFGLPPVGLHFQYILFFLIISIVPILIISAMFLRSANTKLQDRMLQQLEMGMTFAQYLYETDLERLTLATEQAASFSIYQAFHRFLETGQSAPLKKTLTRYRTVKDLDVVMVLDETGAAFSNVSTLTPGSAELLKPYIRRALSGQVSTGLERFTDGVRQHLLSLVAVPVFEFQAPGEVEGVLLTGRRIRDDHPLQTIGKVMPGLDSRLFIREPDGNYRLLTTSNPLLGSAIPDFQQVPDDRAQAAVFEELIQQEHYKSRLMRLQNNRKETIGYLMVSLSGDDMRELHRRSFSYIAGYVFFGLLIIGMTGVWFNRAFIAPIESLTRASHRVSEGDLDVRVRADVSQPALRETMKNFNAMLDELQRTEGLRNTFVATLTHDLRTPIVAQKRVLETFASMGDRLEPDIRAMTTGMLQSNEDLLAMVNQLLEVSHFESGHVALHYEMVSLYSLVEACLRELSPMAAPKKIALTNHVAQDFPEFEADAKQIRRILINLVGNAIQNIGQQKNVEVFAQSRGSFIQITVSDNGPGIPAEALPYVFDRYFSHDHKRQKIGSGLGLYICRMITDLHGGIIKAESREGTGTEFRVILPKYASGKENHPREH